MRSPHDLSRQAAAGGLPARAGGRVAPTERLERRQDVHVHAAQWAQRLPLQQRGSGAAERVCLGVHAHPQGQPHRRGRAASGHRGRRSSHRRGCAERVGAQGAREPSRDQADPAGARVPCANVRRVVLRGTAVATCRSRGRPDVSRRRALLRRHERPRAEHRAQAQPLLPRSAAASRRQHRGGGRAAVVRRRARQRRAWPCGLGLRAPAVLLRPEPQAGRQIWGEQGAFLGCARARPRPLPAQHTAPVVPQQSEAEAGRQLRDQSRGGPACRWAARCRAG